MKKIIGILFGTAVGGAAVFWIAGTVDWWNGWVFLIFLAALGALTARLINSSPGLAEERRTASAKAESWDAVLVRLINLAMPAMVVVAALEMRFRWLPAVPVPVSAAALAMMVPAAMLTYRAMAVNAFFSSHVRIQTDRGHTVVSTGPYRALRHPGYAGAALFNLLVPLMLGSLSALVVGAGVAVLLVYRTAREDRLLMGELAGYSAYARRVRKRLIPGVW